MALDCEIDVMRPPANATRPQCFLALQNILHRERICDDKSDTSLITHELWQREFQLGRC
jgi:hypothetical protein